MQIMRPETAKNAGLPIAEALSGRVAHQPETLPLTCLEFVLVPLGGPKVNGKMSGDIYVLSDFGRHRWRSPMSTESARLSRADMSNVALRAMTHARWRNQPQSPLLDVDHALPMPRPFGGEDHQVAFEGLLRAGENLRRVVRAGGREEAVHQPEVAAAVTTGE